MPLSKVGYKSIVIGYLSFYAYGMVFIYKLKLLISSFEVVKMKKSIWVFIFAIYFCHGGTYQIIRCLF